MSDIISEEFRQNPMEEFMAENEKISNTYRFKKYIQKIRKGKLGKVDLTEFPQWRHIMEQYPFIRDYCNPLEALDIHIIETKTAFGRNQCAAMRFNHILEYNDSPFCEFSYMKIGMSETQCLKKRLKQAFEVEFMNIVHGVERGPCEFGGKGKDLTWEHVPPFTFAKIKETFMKNYDEETISRSLVGKNNVGWCFPDKLAKEFRTYHNKVATLKPCERITNIKMGHVVRRKKQCFAEMLAAKNEQNT